MDSVRCRARAARPRSRSAARADLRYSGMIPRGLVAVENRVWVAPTHLYARVPGLAKAPGLIGVVSGLEMRRAMVCQLFAVCFDAIEPLRLARFWSRLLGWETIVDSPDGVALMPSDDTGFRLRFAATREQRVEKNPMHFDLTSTSLEDQRQTVVRPLGLGARHIDVGQRPEELHVVLADPEGNEFCMLTPR